MLQAKAKLNANGRIVVPAAGTQGARPATRRRADHARRERRAAALDPAPGARPRAADDPPLRSEPTRT